MTGFHSNPVVADTTFSITIGLRLGWKLKDTPPDPNSMTLTASLVPNTLNVEASGARADEAKRGLTDGIRTLFAAPIPIGQVPFTVSALGINVWAVVDLIVTADGGLALLLNPSPDEPALAGLIQAARRPC
jgi:hypothetical protein